MFHVILRNKSGHGRNIVGEHADRAKAEEHVGKLETAYHRTGCEVTRDADGITIECKEPHRECWMRYQIEEVV